MLHTKEVTVDPKQLATSQFIDFEFGIGFLTIRPNFGTESHLVTIKLTESDHNGQT